MDDVTSIEAHYKISKTIDRLLKNFIKKGDNISKQPSQERPYIKKLAGLALKIKEIDKAIKDPKSTEKFLKLFDKKMEYFNQFNETHSKYIKTFAQSGRLIY